MSIFKVMITYSTQYNFLFKNRLIFTFNLTIKNYGTKI